MQKSHKVCDIIEQAITSDNLTPQQELIRAVYYLAISKGQEETESKIRDNLATLPEERYHGIQSRTVNHLLRDNPCARTAPICPAYREIGDWEIKA